MPTPRNRKSSAIEKAEFHEILRTWIRTGEDSVGDPNVAGRTPWLWVRSGDKIAVLHADQKRAGIDTYLGFVSKYGDGIQWSEALSRRGNPTKVALGSEKHVLDNLYLYWVQSNEDDPGSGFPYTAYEESMLWKVIDNQLAQLERNGDLQITTARQYVIGYLCKELDEADLIAKVCST